MTRTDGEKKTFLRKLFATRFGSDAFDQAARSFGPAVFASAPGRVELAGNHTDHQGGRTISAAIEQQAYALAVPNGTDTIEVYLDGFGAASIKTADLEMRDSERGEPISLIRGMAAAYARSGRRLCGFTMVTSSDIPIGCGLSSSAAFEVLLGTSIRALCDLGAPALPHDKVSLALDGVWAERIYFGKPCGAQDQLASAFGGVSAMDFSEDTPRVEPIEFDAAAYPYLLYLIDSRCDHSLYADAFAAIPAEMQAVASSFGRTRLEDVPYPSFLQHLPGLRACLGDRAVLRALHYFEETRRVSIQQRALQAGDFSAFLDQVRLSGASSAQFLQNVFPSSDASGAEQPATVVLALCAHLLDGGSQEAGEHGRGAYRIHGGGFGGSILAFVPDQDAIRFQESMDSLLGYAACTPVVIGTRGSFAERLA